MKLVLREAETKDAAVLCKMFPHWNNAGKRLAQKTRKRFVAEIDGNVVGHIAVKFRSASRAHVAEIESLNILPEFRGKGIGRALEEHTIEKLPKEISLAVCSIASDNTVSIGLQKKLGFRQYGLLEKGVEVNGKLVDSVLMTKEINHL